jgi:glutamyl-tRNA reductase
LSIVSIGVSHRSAPLEMLERLTLAPGQRPKALADLAGRDHLTEVVVLSTCNRCEVYTVAERFHGGYHDVLTFLSDMGDLPVDELGRHLEVRHDDDAVRHLFEVAAGLESAILGESEILGQVKQAWEEARLEDSAGPMLNLLFRHAAEVGKRARTETAIARNITSVSQAAVALAADRLGDLAGREVLVLGAGEIAEGMVVALAGADVGRLAIANRTQRRAELLAERVGADAVPLSSIGSLLERVDVLLAGTGAQSALIEHADLADAVGRRGGRPLLVVDAAVPRNVDVGVAGIDGVTLLDMDDLRAFADSGRQERAREVDRVSEIVDEEVARFADIRSARELDPLVTSLHGLAESLRRAELDRHQAALATLDDDQRAAVEALSRGIVAKLLHGPTVRVKGAAGSLRGDRLADSLRELFDL